MEIPKKLKIALCALLGLVVLLGWGSTAYKLKSTSDALSETKTALSEARSKTRTVIKKIRVPVEIAGKTEFKYIYISDTSTDTEAINSTASSVSVTAKTLQIKAQNQRLFLTLDALNTTSAGVGYAADLPLNISLFGHAGADVAKWPLEPSLLVGVGTRF